MRFKRYKKKRRSNVVRMKFQSFIDISTQADNMQIISVSAGGENVVKRLAPFFQAYKYYKLGNVSIKLIPASTLPVDPTGLSYAEDDFQTVDPRDQLTPGMCRITNGEDILENIVGLTGDQQRSLYDNMLLDPRWFKWMLQTGVKRFGKPRYWQIGQLHQDKWPGAIQNIPYYNEDIIGDEFVGTISEVASFADGTEGNGFQQYAKGGSDPRGIFQTGHKGVLGWMPTDSYQLIRNSDGSLEQRAFIASVPEVELFKIITPPMHKTNYYYRCFITEEVFFKEPIVMNVGGYRGIDVFHTVGLPAPLPPTSTSTIPSGTMDKYSGGNDGSD